VDAEGKVMNAIVKDRLSRVFVVLNPMAGSCTAQDVREALERHFDSDSWTSEIYETTGEEQVAAIVRAALEQDCDLVIAAGGDGTISDVAEGLVHTDVPLGIIAVGTANVLAQELNLPLDLDGACALLAGEHAITSLDAMQVGDKIFVLQIGIGIGSLMVRDTDRAAKRRFGRAAYLWTGLKRLLGYQPQRFTLVVDGQRLRPRAAEIMIANGGILGAAPLRWGPDIRPDDGRIDVCIVSARTAIDYIKVAWHIVSGQQRRGRNIRYLSAREQIIVSGDHPLPVQADGEIIGETPLTVQVVPSAVHVIVPLAEVKQAASAARADLVGV
jgi:YegS/Rv2252/BmrU family lipid kinase